MDAVVLAARAAEDLRRAVREHFVDIHIVRRASARLIDVDDELIAQPPGQDFIGRAHDREADLARQPPERDVRLRRRLFHHDGRCHQLVRRAQSADRKVLHRPRRLRAVVRVRRHADLAERIALDAVGHR
jgi:hypothetical protein